MAKTQTLKRLQVLGERALQGTLVEVMLRCGKAACGCRKDPSRRHGPHLYLKFRDEKGRSTGLYIPRSHEREVRKAVQAWSLMWESMVELSHQNREGLRKRVGRRRKG